MPDNPMICIEHLKKVYGSGASAVAALDDVSLTIRKGDIHGIIGMSGAGKSTLIRCINRLDTPTEGRILIDGQDILAMNEKNLRAMRKRVSMIFQQFNLLMQKTVARNVRYPLEIAGVGRTSASRSCWRSAGCPTRRTPIRRSCPAARSSAWPLPGRWPPIPRCFCATRPPARSTR